MQKVEKSSRIELFPYKRVPKTSDRTGVVKTNHSTPIVQNVQGLNELPIIFTYK